MNTHGWFYAINLVLLVSFSFIMKCFRCTKVIKNNVASLPPPTPRSRRTRGRESCHSAQPSCHVVPSLSLTPAVENSHICERKWVTARPLGCLLFLSARCWTRGQGTLANRTIVIRLCPAPCPPIQGRPLAGGQAGSWGSAGARRWGSFHRVALDSQCAHEGGGRGRSAHHFVLRAQY